MQACMYVSMWCMYIHIYIYVYTYRVYNDPHKMLTLNIKPIMHGSQLDI